MPFLNWQVGSWSFQVNNGSLQADAHLASKILSYVFSHPLPKTKGLMVVMDAGDGEHSFLLWTDRKTVYNAWDDHHAKMAIRIAESMRLYDNHATRGLRSEIDGLKRDKMNEALDR